MIVGMPLQRIRILTVEYDRICGKIRKACKNANIKLPSLVNNQGTQYTVLGLALVFFGIHVGKIKRKHELIAFLRMHGCKTTDPQPRHLGMQCGLDFLIMGSKHPRTKKILKAGEYCLWSLGKSHPNAANQHRMNPNAISKDAFAIIKRKYNSRCASCGSPEGQPNYKNAHVITTLEKGHMDPRKPIDINKNCIPICGVCNKVYKNRVVFTQRGFVKPIRI
jgi:hypothetical protein